MNFKNPADASSLGKSVLLNSMQSVKGRSEIEESNKKPIDHTDFDSIKLKFQANNPNSSDILDAIIRQRTVEKPAISLVENEFAPVLVQISGCDDLGRYVSKESQIDLLSHCILCRRKTADSGDLLEICQKVGDQEKMKIVPRAKLSSSSSTFLNSFNRIWSDFEKKNEFKAEEEFKKKTAMHDQNYIETKFLELPRTCVFCQEVLEKVHRLYMELNRELELIAKTLADSNGNGKYSWRTQQLEQALKDSHLEDKVIYNTKNLLDKLEKVSGVQLNGSVSRLEDRGACKRSLFTCQTPKVKLTLPSIDATTIPTASSECDVSVLATQTIGGPNESTKCLVPRPMNKNSSCYLVESNKFYKKQARKVEFEPVKQRSKGMQKKSAARKVQRMPITTQTCYQCNSNFSTDAMVLHLIKVHGAAEVVECKYCHHSFSTRELMLDHLYEHRNQAPFSCDTCRDRVKFTKYSSLLRHYFKKHGIGKRYPCGDCGHTSWSQRQATGHAKEKHKVRDEMVITKLPKLDKVENVYHAAFSPSPKEKNSPRSDVYRCELCQISFTSVVLYWLHKQEHEAGQGDKM